MVVCQTLFGLSLALLGWIYILSISPGSRDGAPLGRYDEKPKNNRAVEGAVKAVLDGTLLKPSISKPP